MPGLKAVLKYDYLWIEQRVYFILRMKLFSYVSERIRHIVHLWVEITPLVYRSTKPLQWLSMARPPPELLPQIVDTNINRYFDA